MKRQQFYELYVKDGRILPNDVDVIEGDLNLRYCEITKIENLPKIEGRLDLSDNKITKIENLPICKEIILTDNPLDAEFLISDDISNGLTYDDHFWENDVLVTKIRELKKSGGVLVAYNGGIYHIADNGNKTKLVVAN